jgi:hypothetical protein
LFRARKAGERWGDRSATTDESVHRHAIAAAKALDRHQAAIETRTR